MDDFMNQFGQYYKMQDSIMLLGSSENLVAITCNLNLYTMKKNNLRHFYSEVQYLSEATNTEMRKIKRDYDIYLQLENIKPIGTYREFIAMKGKDLEYFKLHIVPKFRQIIYNREKVYRTRPDGLMVVNENIKPFQVDVGRKSLLFRPGVQVIDDEEQKPIIEMFMNSNKDNQVNLDFDQVYEFMYFINTFNLYNYAASMLSFVGRPDPDTNLYDITSKQEYKQIEPKVPQAQVKRRFIGDSDKKSPFIK